jgi:glycine/D-amino acid oxidase-like deaminating enzyme
MASVAVAGAGIFGITAALALRQRGYDVTVFDPGPLPHPLAESTDISKIVRLEYGDDEVYTALMEKALARWRTWSAASLFHETGVMFLRRSPLEPGSFEHDSFAMLTRRGHAVQRLDGRDIARRFPAWGRGFVEGTYNPQGGWAESGRVVAFLARLAQDAGARLAPGTALARVVEEGGRVVGLQTADGGVHRSDFVLVAAGSWTQHVLPFMAPCLRSVGQPVFHLAPADVAPYAHERFPVFGADIARTGYYGFPANDAGLVKMANHGPGRPMHPGSPERVVTEEETDRLRAFLRDGIPGLAAAPIAATRVCVYGDTVDQHFWIAPDPDRRGLVVAAGGSGHGFKFAPLLGDLIADAVEGQVHPRFRWRPEIAEQGRGEERARHQG